MRRYTVEAIVLKNINYKDSHKIYTLLTKEHGKISALGMGVRKISSRRAGNLDTLNHVQVGLSEDTKGFKTINEVRTLNSHKNIKSDLKKSYYALRMTDLVARNLSDEHEELSVFNLTLEALNMLTNHSNKNDLILLFFMLNLLDMLGLGVDSELLGPNQEKFNLISRTVKKEGLNFSAPNALISKSIKIIDHVFSREFPRVSGEATSARMLISDL